MDRNGTNRNTDRYGGRSGSGRAGSGAGRNSTGQQGAPRRNQMGQSSPGNGQRDGNSRGWAYPDDGGGIYSGMNGMNGMNGRADPRMNGGTGMNGRAGRQYYGGYEDPNEASMRRVRANQARHREQLRREREAQQKAQRRAALKYNILLVLKLFSATFVVCAAVIAGLYFVTFFGKESKYPDVTYTYINTKAERVDSSISYKNGVLYVDFTALANKLGMSVTGGAQKMKFVIPGDGAEGTDGALSESVEFRVGSAQLWVNSQETRSESASVMRGENMWVPLSVITDYMRGLKVESDEKTVSITRIHAQGSTKENPIYEDVYFTLKNPSALAPVDKSCRYEKRRQRSAADAAYRREGYGGYVHRDARRRL